MIWWGTDTGDYLLTNILVKKVSVIIPCFNATNWLPKCFLSLVQQTIGIENIELIFVNDASTDND